MYFSTELTLPNILKSNYMKKLILFVLSIFVLAACVKKSDYETLKTEHDSVVAQLNDKSVEVNQYFEQLNEIEKNFSQIKELEQFVAVETSNDKINNQAAERIKNNINMITELFNKNKEMVESLQKNLNKSKGEYKALQNTLANYSEKLLLQGLMIDSMKIEIENRDEKILQLDRTVNTLNEEVTVLSSNIKEKEEKIVRQDDAMHTAWYVFGSRKELKTQRIITSEGAFQSKLLQSDFNKDYFVKIDIRKTLRIPLYAKKAKILTNHKATSYQIEDENGNKVIQIKDPVEFWKLSKYLVIEVN